MYFEYEYLAIWPIIIIIGAFFVIKSKKSKPHSNCCDSPIINGISRNYCSSCLKEVKPEN